MILVSKVSLDYEGEFIVVNCHGNVSYYVREHRAWSEGKESGTLIVDKLIWDVV